MTTDPSSGARSTPRAADLVHLRASDPAAAAIVLIALAGTAAGMMLSFATGWAVWLAGQVILGFALVQWFVILHECGHDTLFRTRRWHAVVGRIAGFCSMIPYHAWVRVHARHHKWTGWQDLDPTTAALVPRELRRAERVLINICWRLWIPLFSILYRVTNFWNVRRLAAQFPHAADRRIFARDAGALLAGYGALAVWLGPEVLLRAFGVAVLISLIIEDLLLLSQHSHVPQHLSHGNTVKPFAAIAQEQFTRSLRLPQLASAFVLHFDAHELHHMYPFVPGYHLRRIDVTTDNEVSWWQWITHSKQLRADVLLFKNRSQTGWDI